MYSFTLSHLLHYCSNITHSPLLIFSWKGKGSCRAVNMSFSSHYVGTKVWILWAYSARGLPFRCVLFEASELSIYMPVKTWIIVTLGWYECRITRWIGCAAVCGGLGTRLPSGAAAPTYSCPPAVRISWETRRGHIHHVFPVLYTAAAATLAANRELTHAAHRCYVTCRPHVFTPSKTATKVRVASSNVSMLGCRRCLWSTSC